MRFIIAATHKSTKRKYPRIVVGVESIEQVPAAVADFEVTDIRDANDKPISDWKKQLADAEAARKKTEAAERA